MNDTLYEEKIISKEEYGIAKSKLLNKRYTLPDLESSILGNETGQRDKEKDLLQIDHDIARQELSFEQALKTLKSNVEDWMHKYLISAPVTGKVVLTTPVQENKFLQQGRLLGYVIPDNAQYYAELVLPQSNFGKMDTGLKVQLRFEAYPYQEYGFVKGQLNYISKVPSDSGFMAMVKLKDGLTTNYGRIVPYRNHLRARAIIITRNMNLLKRIYYGIVREDIFRH